MPVQKQHKDSVSLRKVKELSTSNNVSLVSFGGSKLFTSITLNELFGCLQKWNK